MQAYTSSFAHVYNKLWAGFANQLAPRLLDYYQRFPISRENRTVLDVCCGTGQLAAHLLKNGYRVIGIDSSEGMLQHASENCAPYVAAGQARFIQADAACFTLDTQVGLAVSTYDALNHLEDMAALRSCFGCVLASLAEDGQFLFDLNTRKGLQSWNGISVEDNRDALIISRGIYDEEAGRATIRITGFMPAEGGLYERFEETAFNTLFDLQAVKTVLLEAGWRSVHFARSQDLSTPVDDPEAERRIFVVALR
jgi:SAM-dependent methyltransferase